LNAPELKTAAKSILGTHGPLTANEISGLIGGTNKEKVDRVLRRTPLVYLEDNVFELLEPGDPKLLNLTISGDMTTCDWYPRLFGQAIMHSWVEIAFLEQLLSHYDFDGIVELGTASGGLTTLFMLHAIRTGSHVLSIDINEEPDTEPYKKLSELCMYEFIRGDAIKPNVPDEYMIERAIRFGNKTLLYCDANGYKEARFDQMKQWLPYMKIGDIVISHDYPYQITDEQVAPLVELHNLVPFHQDEALSMGCRMLLFEKC